MDTTLKRVKEMLEDINYNNSTTDKLKKLKNYPDLKDLLRAVYDTNLQYWVTSSNIKKKEIRLEDVKNQVNAINIFDLLIKLSNRDVTGHDAIYMVQDFIRKNKDYEDIILKVIDKNLETRIDVKGVNKVFPGLVPVFSVALAEKFEPKYVDFKDSWFSSHKLDGVRCIAILDANGDVTFYSRAGKEFTTLGNVKKDLKQLGLGNIVFDGELCIVDDNGVEDFQGIMKLIKKKDSTISNPMYKIFDVLSKADFYACSSDIVLSSRYESLLNLKKLPRFNSLKTLNIVEQTLVKDQEHFVALQKEASDKGWEGLILRKDSPYVGDRSRDMLKVKEWKDDEWVVTGIALGPIRVIENGVEVTQELVSNLTIMHKGNQVGVGTGLSQEQRRAWKERPNDIIGKTVTIKYFEETNVNGVYSLRFPVLKVVHGDSRDV